MQRVILHETCSYKYLITFLLLYYKQKIIIKQQRKLYTSLAIRWYYVIELSRHIPWHTLLTNSSQKENIEEY